MKRKLKKGPQIILTVVGLLIVLFLTFIILLKVNTSKVNNSDKVVEFEVKEGSTFISISENLKKENLIKSEFWYKLYVKFENPSGLQAGKYNLKRNMNVSELIKKLGTGAIDDDYLNVTFREGINIRKFIKIVTENTSITEEEIINTLNNEEYLNKLINKYWFLSEEIKNNNIYYSLEGYLYPDTYQIKTDGKIEDIIETMLSNLELKLSSYKNEIKNNKYSFHELLTLASIVELEAGNSNDRNGVAGVFYNRLNNNWSLGSDVTTYYGAKIDLNERDLYQKELDEYNSYNTRNSKMAGKLPVGPICNPSIESIIAAIEPSEHSYFYFVADKNKNTYFTKTNSEHLSKIAELKNKGLWYEY